MIRGKRCSACRQNGVDDVVLIHRCHITNKNESTSTDSNVVNSQYTLRPPASRVLFSTSQLAQAKTRRDSSNSTITPTARSRSANTTTRSLPASTSHSRQHDPPRKTPPGLCSSYTPPRGTNLHLRLRLHSLQPVLQHPSLQDKPSVLSEHKPSMT